MSESLLETILDVNFIEGELERMLDEHTGRKEHVKEVRQNLDAKAER